MDIPALLKSEPIRKGRRGKGVKRSEIKEILTLLILNREGPIGRYRLKERLNLSEREGVVRYMLADLQSQGYVSASRSGCALTPKGKELLEKRLRAYGIIAIKTFYSPILTSAPASVGLHLQNKADKIESTMNIRDLAVRGGAVGATIFLFREEKLTVPSVPTDFLSMHPNLVIKIHESFNLENNDVIAVISAEDERKGIEAAITIAKDLSNKWIGPNTVKDPFAVPRRRLEKNFDKS